MHSKKIPFDWIGLLILTLPPLFWAGNFVIGRAVHTLMPPFTLSFMRWSLAIIVLMPFAWKHLKQGRALYWEYRWRILGLSLLGAAAFNALIYLALRSTTATNAVLLNSFAPILIILWGILFYKQRTNFLQIAGLLLSFMGVMMIVLQGSWQHLLSLSFSKGDFIVLIAVVCWSIYTLWLRVLPAQMNKVGLTAIQFVIAALVIFPFAFIEYTGGNRPIWTQTSMLAVAYIGVFPSVLAFLLYTLGVMRVGAARAGQFLHLMPVFGALLSAFFLKEHLHLYHLGGITCIFAGILLSTYSAKK
ncbi:MAG: DMT family transporter [Saezia sp.]